MNTRDNYRNYLGLEIINYFSKCICMFALAFRLYVVDVVVCHRPTDQPYFLRMRMLYFFSTKNHAFLKRKIFSFLQFGAKKCTEINKVWVFKSLEDINLFVVHSHRPVAIRPCTLAHTHRQTQGRRSLDSKSESESVWKIYEIKKTAYGCSVKRLHTIVVYIRLTHRHSNTHDYICLYQWVCVCVWVFMRLTHKCCLV